MTKKTCDTCKSKTPIGGCEIISDNPAKSVSIKRPLTIGEMNSIRDFGCIRHNE